MDCVGGLFVAGMCVGASQAAAPEEGVVKLPEFAVVSVKPTPVDRHMGKWRVMPDGISSRDPASWLLVAGFGLLRSDRVINAPEWAKEEWYDVEARVDAKDVDAFTGLTQGQKTMTLRAILVDRFKLKYHFETRQFAGVALTVAKASPGLVVAAAPTAEHPRGLGTTTGGIWCMRMGSLWRTWRIGFWLRRFRRWWRIGRGWWGDMTFRWTGAGRMLRGRRCRWGVRLRGLSGLCRISLG